MSSNISENIFYLRTNIFGDICSEICIHLNMCGRSQADICQKMDESDKSDNNMKEFYQMVAYMNIEVSHVLSDLSIPISSTESSSVITDIKTSRYLEIIRNILTKYPYANMLESTVRFATFVTRPDRKFYYIFRTSDLNTYRIDIIALQKYQQSFLTQISHLKSPGSIIDVDIPSIYFEQVVLFYETNNWPFSHINDYVYTIGSNNMNCEEFRRTLGLYY